MKILLQIAMSLDSYLNNIAGAFKRLKLKGDIPTELTDKFEQQLLELAKTTDEIKNYATKVKDE